MSGNNLWYSIDHGYSVKEGGEWDESGTWVRVMPIDWEPNNGITPEPVAVVFLTTETLNSLWEESTLEYPNE